jgi:RNA polymerase-interacting CarD/CdnL/TRCF family regulator
MLIEINDFIADFVVGNKIFDPIFGVGKIIEKQTFQEKTTDEKEYLYNIVFSDGDKGSKEFLIPLFEDVNYIVI